MGAGDGKGNNWDTRIPQTPTGDGPSDTPGARVRKAERAHKEAVAAYGPDSEQARDMKASADQVRSEARKATAPSAILQRAEACVESARSRLIHLERAEANARVMLTSAQAAVAEAVAHQRGGVLRAMAKRSPSQHGPHGLW